MTNLEEILALLKEGHCGAVEDRVDALLDEMDRECEAIHHAVWQWNLEGKGMTAAQAKHAVEVIDKAFETGAEMVRTMGGTALQAVVREQDYLNDDTAPVAAKKPREPWRWRG